MNQVVQGNDQVFFNESASQWWNPDAKVYALYYLNPCRFKYFDHYIPNWQHLKVLDLGCGGGFTCEFLAQRGAQVFGIDPLHNCIDTAKRHAIDSKLDINYQQGFAENLPYSDNFFDVVVCVDVLEHVANLKKTIAEIHRTLKPNGLFCFDTVNRTFESRFVMIWLLENILQEIPKGMHDWQKFIQPKELTTLMQSKGLESIEIKGFNLFGDNLSAYIFNALKHLITSDSSKKAREFQVTFSERAPVMYIGIAKKLASLAKS